MAAVTDFGALENISNQLMILKPDDTDQYALVNRVIIGFDNGMLLMLNVEQAIIRTNDDLLPIVNSGKKWNLCRKLFIHENVFENVVSKWSLWKNSS